MNGATVQWQSSSASGEEKEKQCRELIGKGMEAKRPDWQRHCMDGRNNAEKSKETERNDGRIFQKRSMGVDLVWD